MKKTLGTIVAIMVVASLIGTFITAKSSTAGEKAKDGRFIAYDNGTVLDTKTKLMWAAKDNGSDINWQDAKFYCENYHGGGYTDWRMPTLDELDGLYDASKSHPAACYGRNSIHVATELIDITCFCPWASETSETTGEVDFFDFGPGIRSGFASQWTRFSRVLPVRSGK
jgi:Protein of unknown function (DUF1566).